MSVPEVYRNNLRERLLGKGSTLVPKDFSSINEKSNSSVFDYWKGNPRRNMSNNLHENPFKWNWNCKAGNKSINLMDDTIPDSLLKEEKPVKNTDTFPKNKYKVI